MSWWSRPIFFLAGLKAIAGVVGYALHTGGFRPPPSSPSPIEVNLAQVLVYFAAAALLILGSRADPRAAHLGGFFLMISSRYARRLLVDLDAPASALVDFLRTFGQLRVDESFMALFLWLFVARFPDTPTPFWVQRLTRTVIRAAAVGGVFYFTLSCWQVTSRFLGLDPALPDALRAVDSAALRWAIFGGLIFAASIMVGYKAWRSPPGPEKRRSRLFTFALLATCGPVIFDSLIEATVPAYAALLRAHRTAWLVRILYGNVLFFILPLATAYSVLVHQVLDVKLIARKALQHALAKSTALAVVAAPFVLLCLLVYRHRHLTVAEIVAGPQVLLLLAAIAVGGLALKYRRPALDAIDRHYFREQYNARRILTELVAQVRGTRSLVELSNLVGRGIDLALHLERVAVLVADPALGQLVDPKREMRPLDLGSRLATVVQGNHQPLDVDLGAAASPLGTLPESEHHWLVDGQVQLLAPAFASDGGLIGLIVLGGKKSELPFLREDRQLLADICSATGLVIELLLLKERSSVPRLAHAADAGADDGDLQELAGQARECPGCCRVFPPDRASCDGCRIELDTALVPYVLRQMFRFEERIGTGGMAIVYRAIDLKLGRTVAIKTLPRVSPEAAARLHREARAAAAVSHPGLAAIYGMETWEGTPMLILELLAGGTLADRIMESVLTPLAAIDTGQSVALALARIHSAGILHRDVKPSNIGYTLDGAAKLLDFGIARLHHDLRRDRAAAPGDAPEDTPAVELESWEILRTATGQIAGTLSYLSPEAVEGAEPAPSFDLWSLCVVLFEALTGENLFTGRDLRAVLDEIRHARVPDLRQRLPDCPAALHDFFRRNLHRDRGRRAATGRELHQQLEQVRQGLVGQSPLR